MSGTSSLFEDRSVGFVWVPISTCSNVQEVARDFV